MRLSALYHFIGVISIEITNDKGGYLFVGLTHPIYFRRKNEARLIVGLVDVLINVFERCPYLIEFNGFAVLLERVLKIRYENLFPRSHIILIKLTNANQLCLWKYIIADVVQSMSRWFEASSFIIFQVPRCEFSWALLVHLSN